MGVTRQRAGDLQMRAHDSESTQSRPLPDRHAWHDGMEARSLDSSWERAPRPNPKIVVTRQAVRLRG